jgi:hypothetical protein
MVLSLSAQPLLRKNSLLAVLGAAHGLVDAACAALVFGLVWRYQLTSQEYILLVVGYNVLAFAFQPLCLLGAAVAFLIFMKTPEIHENILLKPETFKWPAFIGCLLLVSIMIRSLVGFSAGFPWHNDMTVLFLIVCAAFAGKALWRHPVRQVRMACHSLDRVTCIGPAARFLVCLSGCLYCRDAAFPDDNAGYADRSASPAAEEACFFIRPDMPCAHHRRCPGFYRH